MIFIKNSFTNKNYYIGISGKSGGHILPLINILKNKKEKNNYNILITTNTDLDKKIVNHFLIQKDLNLNYFINLDNIPNNFINFLFYIPNFIVYIFKILYILIKYNIKDIYTTGGYISVPVCIFCKILRIPIHLYLLDTIPGNAANFIYHFSDFNYFFSNFSKEDSNKFPLQFNKNDIKDNLFAKKQFNIDLNKKVLFIVGGSQGATEINNIITSSVSQLNKNITKNLFIIHQTGKIDCEKIKKFYNQIEIDSIVFDYSFNCIDYYCAADFVISRAGASSLYEIIYLNKNALIIPLKNSANSHQEKNSIIASKNNAFIDIIINKNELETIEKTIKFIEKNI